MRPIFAARGRTCTDRSTVEAIEAVLQATHMCSADLDHIGSLISVVAAAAMALVSQDISQRAAVLRSQRGCPPSPPSFPGLIRSAAQ